MTGPERMGFLLAVALAVALAVLLAAPLLLPPGSEVLRVAQAGRWSLLLWGEGSGWAESASVDWRWAVAANS